MYTRKFAAALFVIGKKLETSQMFTYGQMVEYVIYSCSEILYGNKREVATAVCNNNSNVINIMLSKRVHTIGFQNRPFLTSCPLPEGSLYPMTGPFRTPKDPTPELPPE